MARVAPHTRDHNLSAKRGVDVDLLVGPLLRLERAEESGVLVDRWVPIDLTVPATRLRLRAKRTLADVAYLIEVDSDVSGVALNSPVTADKNLATVTIPAAASAGFLVEEDLIYDVKINHSDIGEDITSEGRITFAISVSHD